MRRETFIYNTLLPFIFLLLINKNLNAQQFTRVEVLTGLNGISNNNGVAIADFDLDNDLDIFVVGTMTYDSNNPNTWSRLLKNNNGVFQDITITAGFAEAFNHEMTFIIMNSLGDSIPADINFGMGKKMGASWGDYNNDGYPDIFLSNAVQSQLYKNNGNSTFTNVTAAAGFEEICIDCYLTGALWWDYNNDGFLDLYITDYNFISDNKLYKNNGDETFTLISDTNLSGSSNSLSAISIDANNDGFLDLYVANDFDKNNFLYINQNGTGFVDSAVLYGIEDPFDGMGLAICDFDNNGNYELLISNIKENGFYVKTSSNAYTNKAIEYGISDTDWAWGAVFSDFNLDGFEDFFIATGFTGAGQIDHYFKNILNNNSRIFAEEPITQAGAIETSLSRSAVSFDYDNDGDLDLVVTDFGSNLFFYENTNGNNNSWTKIKLIGTVSNKDALGSKVEITTNNNSKQYRFCQGSGYQSQSLQPVHFGLVNATIIDSLTITWPTGLQETYTNLPVNETIVITENNGFTLNLDDHVLPNHNMNVYPNPVKQFSEITITNTLGNNNFLLIDLLGRTIPVEQRFISESNITKIYTGNLSPGIYILKTKNISKKIIIN